jgi:hypothetical protein
MSLCLRFQSGPPALPSFALRIVCALFFRALLILLDSLRNPNWEYLSFSTSGDEFVERIFRDHKGSNDNARALFAGSILCTLHPPLCHSELLGDANNHSRQRGLGTSQWNVKQKTTWSNTCQIFAPLPQAMASLLKKEKWLRGPSVSPLVL